MLCDVILTTLKPGNQSPSMSMMFPALTSRFKVVLQFEFVDCVCPNLLTIVFWGSGYFHFELAFLVSPFSVDELVEIRLDSWLRFYY